MELIAEINRIFNADGTQAVEFESKTNAYRAIGVSSANLEGNEAPLSKQSAFGFDNAPASQTPVDASPVAPAQAAPTVETPVAPAQTVAPAAPVMPAASEVNAPAPVIDAPAQTEVAQSPAPEAPVQEALPAQEPVAPAQAEVPSAPVVDAPITETPAAQTPAVETVAETPAIESNTEQVTLGNDTTPEPAPAETTEPEVLEDLSPKPTEIKPAVVNDVIEDRPVENADFESLMEYSFKPKEEVKEETPEEPKEETPEVVEEVKPLEMPTVSDEIVAPEPTEINNELFNINEINTPAPAVETMADTPFVEAPLTNPATEATEEVKIEDIPSIEEANPITETVPSNDVETLDVTPETKVEESTIPSAPINELETVPMDNEVKEEVPAMDLIGSSPVIEKPEEAKVEDIPTLEEPEVKTEEPVLETIPTLTEEPINSEVDNMVSENVSNLDYEAIKKELINVIKEDVEKVLNKYINNDHVENIATEPAIVNDINQVEEVPVVLGEDKPVLENPIGINEALNETNTITEEKIENNPLMQGNEDLLSIDNTPIKGKFI